MNDCKAMKIDLRYRTEFLGYQQAIATSFFVASVFAASATTGSATAVSATAAPAAARTSAPPASTNLATKLPRALAVPGGIAIVKVADAQTQLIPPTVSSDGKRVWTVNQNGAWFAVVGLPLSIKPGEHTIDINHDGQTKPQKISFVVKDKKYAVQRLTISNKAMVDPPPEVQDRIEKESKHLAKVRATFSASTATQGAFSLPADGRLSSKFGLGRVLNGQVRSPHAGLDLAIGVGTPVVAAADGVLLDADDYYYCGKTAFIDHGNGLISMHCHLNEFVAKVGDVVKRGDVIGKSGVTGRITGPHLHWSIYLNAVSVDPELFLNQAVTEKKPAKLP